MAASRRLLPSVWEVILPPVDLPQGMWGEDTGRSRCPPSPPGALPCSSRLRAQSKAVTRPGGDDAAGRAGHSWPLPARSPTPLAWVTAPAKLPDTETPRGLRVSGTILPLMGSDSSAPPSSEPSLHRSSPRPAVLPGSPRSPAPRLARQVAPRIPLRGVGFV